MFKFHTKNWHDDYAKITQGEYPDGSIKLIIRGRYNQILCVPTICLADMNEHPAPGSVFIQDYGSYEGVLRTLQDAGVVGPTEWGRVVETGTHTRDPLLRRPVHEVRLLTTDV